MTTTQAAPNSTNSDSLPTLKEPTAAEKRQGKKANNGVPRVNLSQNGFSIHHPDPKVGEQLMMRAFATTDRDFMYGMVRQLANAASSQGQQADEIDLNFMISAVAGLKPRDQFEAMLLAQSVAVHVATMRSANYLANTENIFQQDSGERVFNKLARTFLSQMDGLKRYRTVGEQTVTVQNVSVEHGGQAIVGNVTQHPSIAAVSPPALTDARTALMPILENREPELAPSPLKPQK